MKVGKAFQIGIGLGATSWILGMILTLLGKSGITGLQSSLAIAPIAEGVKQNIQSGINTSLAAKIIGWLNGLPLFDFMGLLTLALGGFLIVWIGSFIFDWLVSTFKGLAWFAKTPIRNLVSIAVIGTIVSAWIVTIWSNSGLSGIKLPAFTAVLTMVIYFTIVAFVYGALAKVSKGTQAEKVFIEA